MATATPRCRAGAFVDHEADYAAYATDELMATVTGALRATETHRVETIIAIGYVPQRSTLAGQRLNQPLTKEMNQALSMVNEYIRVGVALIDHQLIAQAFRIEGITHSAVPIITR